MLGKVKTFAAVAVGAFVLAASPASALSTHTLSTSFAGSGASALSDPSDVAVDQQSHDIYVTDPANFRVVKFDSAGNFVLTFGNLVNRSKIELKTEELERGEQVTVTESDENICTAASGDTCQAGRSGKGARAPLPSQFTMPEFVAVDNSGGLSAGDVYVRDPSENVIFKFDSSGRPITSWVRAGQLSLDYSYNPNFRDQTPPEIFNGSPLTEGLAVDANGDLLFGFYADFRFGQFGSFISSFVPPVPGRVAAGPQGDTLDMAIDRATHVLSPAGADAGSLTGASFAGPTTATALDFSTGEFYVADDGSVIRHYGADCEPTTSPCTPTDAFGSGELGEVTGLAVDETSGAVYAVDGESGQVDVFAPTPYLPDVKALAVKSGPTDADATLLGQVNPAEGGEVDACALSYVPESSFTAHNRNEVQTVTPSGATGGTYTLTFMGQTTQPISFNASPFPGPNTFDPGAVNNRLQELSTIGLSNVRVSGSEGGPYTIEFVGALARQNVPQLTVDDSALTPQPAAETAIATEADGGDGWEGAVETPCLDEGGEAVNTHPVPDSDTPSGVHAALPGLSPETTYRYRIIASNGNGTARSNAHTFTSHRVIGLTTEAATGLGGQAATLNGSLLGDGTATHYYFEWGTTTAYVHKVPESPTAIGSPSGPNLTHLSAALTGLSPNTAYHYRVVAENGASEVSQGEDESFTTPPNLPGVVAESVGHVRSDSALFQGQVNPGSGDTSYHIEYGTEACSAGPCAESPVPGLPIGNGKFAVPISVRVTGLLPGTIYHYRLVAQSIAGTTKGTERTFTTLPFVGLEHDACPNAHVRQQTGAAGLPDCRAYELVSAANAGGYDVESSVVPDQTPFGSYPQAEGRVLYGVHDGGIPGTNHPTNRGVDPYVASRGENSWSTEYVGIPANDPFSNLPFSSDLLEADAALRTFAFGGEEICSPCFEDGSSGNPIRTPDGKLVQGMAGPGGAISSAEPAGFVGKNLSADGSHFVFGSTSQFATDGNNNGDVSIYDRNLNAPGETHVVSKTPTGETMTGPGIGELDISSNGSRVVVGRLVSEEGSAKRWHLYMNIGDSAHTVDLTPGTTTGVLYDGMTADGSRVFFTTDDQLSTATDQDADHSADLYEAEVDSGGSVTLIRVSTGTEGTGDSDGCEPAANSVDPHWNTTDPEREDCGVVAIGGGGGVASADGVVYFLSPEQLDGSANGTENAPNLYVAHPGQPPHYVATLQSTLNGPQPPRRARFSEGNFGALTDATGVAVDHTTKDVYVLDLGNESTAATVRKFDAAGNPIAFTKAAPYIEGNTLKGPESGSFGELPELGVPTQLAVDPSNGRLYVPNLFGGAVDVFAPSGEYLFEIGGVGFPTGVSVDPANHNVYVSSYFGTVSIFEPSGTPVTSFSVGGFGTAAVAADAGGRAYAINAGTTSVFDSSGTFVMTLDKGSSQSVAVEPLSGDVYVDEGSQIARYDSAGDRLDVLGSGLFTGSIGLGVDAGGGLYASNEKGTRVAAFSPLRLLPTPAIDSPLVLDSVREPGARHTADFQVTPDDGFAVFASSLELTGYESGEVAEIYRYEPAANGGAGDIECASCDPTNGEAEGAPSLAVDGLSLAEDGRVFFTTDTSMVSGDTDGVKDVYEWEPRNVGNCQPESPTYNPAVDVCVGLISAGTGTFDSGLLGIDSSGRDAYFFTRDSLVSQDVNGPTMKIYDAREGGGFPYLFPAAGCRASDECHGAASPPPGKQELSSESGTSHNFEGACKRGFVRKHGHCVRKRHTHRHHHRQGRGHDRRGGGK